MKHGNLTDVGKKSFFFRDNDDQLSFVETNDLFMSVLKFFGDASCRLTVDGLIEGLRKLGEPREVTEAVRRYLVPILETLPRWEIIKCHGEETQHKSKFWHQADSQVSGASLRRQQGWKDGGERTRRFFRFRPCCLDMAGLPSLCQKRFEKGDELLQVSDNFFILCL